MQCNRGLTALMYAAKDGVVGDDRKEMIQLLINAGADVNKQDIHGETVLISMLRLKGENVTDIMQLLIDAGVDVNKQDIYGYTALMCVVSSPLLAACGANRHEEVDAIAYQRWCKC